MQNIILNIVNILYIICAGVLFFYVYKQYNQSKYFIKKMSKYIKEQELKGKSLGKVYRNAGTTYHILIGELLCSNYKENNIFYVEFKNGKYSFEGKNIFLNRFYDNLDKSMKLANKKKKENELKAKNKKFEDRFKFLDYDQI